ncbi:MAG TPA: o-succinylbenzoate synthase [Gemmatimonadaceae bacterium]|nr:o-succinylbenzoate synthase [Gemmatimonadaceae bacterium]
MTTALRIDRARLWEVALPLTVPFAISGGVMHIRRSLIVELTSSDGAIGFGESAPFELPFYSSETLESVRWMLGNVLLPRLLNRTLAAPTDADALLMVGVRGNPFARAGAETAVWDLFCHHARASLLDLLTHALRDAGVAARELAPRDRIECGIALGIPDTGGALTVERWTREALSQGYRRVKIKIRPGWDVQALRAARSAIVDHGRDVMMWADANASYDLGRDLDALRAVDEHGLRFIEQPLQHDDLLDHAALATRLRTPICLDESLRDARWARQAVSIGASRIWNIKVQRLGGLTEALRVYALAAERDVALWGGTMPETGIGARTILSLGALPRFVYPSDVEPSERWYSGDSDPLPLVMADDGTMAVPREKGLATLGLGERLTKVGTVVWSS